MILFYILIIQFIRSMFLLDCRQLAEEVEATAEAAVVAAMGRICRR